MYLGTNASSVHVESLFSTAGLLLNRKRSSLTSEKLKMIVFIHDDFERIVEALANDTAENGSLKVIDGHSALPHSHGTPKALPHTCGTATLSWHSLALPRFHGSPMALWHCFTPTAFPWHCHTLMVLPWHCHPSMAMWHCQTPMAPPWHCHTPMALWHAYFSPLHCSSATVP